MTPSAKLVRRMLRLPVRDSEKLDAEVAAEIIKFKAEVRKAGVIARWIARKSKQLRELNDDLLEKVE